MMPGKNVLGKPKWTELMDGLPMIPSFIFPQYLPFFLPISLKYILYNNIFSPSSSVYYCLTALFLHMSTALAVATAPIGFLQPPVLLLCSPVQDHRSPLTVQSLVSQILCHWMFFSWMAYASTLKMDAVGLPRTLVDITQHSITS
jgi:hypothetical protein